MSGDSIFVGREYLSKEAAARLTETYREEYALQSALYPTLVDTPTCTQLVFERMNCVMSAGNHRRHLYLDGKLDDCKLVQDKFKKCWKVWYKLPNKEARRDAFIRHRAEMWTARRVGPSSEDIWNIRKAPPPDFPPRLDPESMRKFKQHMEGTIPKHESIV